MNQLELFQVVDQQESQPRSARTKLVCLGRYRVSTIKKFQSVKMKKMTMRRR
jgi:hypothetical protein